MTEARCRTGVRCTSLRIGLHPPCWLPTASSRRGNPRCRTNAPRVESSRPLQARCDGCDLHAGVMVAGEDRPRLEQLCRYLLRPPIAGCCSLARRPAAAAPARYGPLLPEGEAGTRSRLSAWQVACRSRVRKPRGIPTRLHRSSLSLSDQYSVPVGKPALCGACHSNRPVATRLFPPLTEDSSPLAVALPPPLIEALAPLAVLNWPPLTDATLPFAVLTAPPLTEASS